MHPIALAGSEWVDTVSKTVWRVYKHLSGMTHGVVGSLRIDDGNRNARCHLCRFDLFEGTREPNEVAAEGVQEASNCLRGISRGIHRDEYHRRVAPHLWQSFEHLGKLSQVDRAYIRAIGVPEIQKCESAFRLRHEIEGTTVGIGQRERTLWGWLINFDSLQLTDERNPRSSASRKADGDKNQDNPKAAFEHEHTQRSIGRHGTT